jgi:predicted metal-dependent phosphoesterase TrpH
MVRNMIVDLHVKAHELMERGHTPEAIIQAAVQAGLDGIGVVDRLQSGALNSLIAQSEERGICVFAGVEIPTLRGSFLCYPPEIDPFLLRQEWRQVTGFGVLPTYGMVSELFSDLGGVIIAPQPFDRDEKGARLGDSVVLIKGLSAIQSATVKSSTLNRNLAVELAMGLGIPTVGGSGHIGRLEDIGKAATLFERDFTQQSEFVSALQLGQFWAIESRHSSEARRDRGHHDSRQRRSSRGPGKEGDGRNRNSPPRRRRSRTPGNR